MESIVGFDVIRTSPQIETAAAELDWLDNGLFVGQPNNVVHKSYLVQ